MVAAVDEREEWASLLVVAVSLVVVPQVGWWTGLALLAAMAPVAAVLAWTTVRDVRRLVGSDS